MTTIIDSTRRNGQTESNPVRAYFIKIFDAKVINISQGGIALGTPYPLTIGQAYVFLIKHRDRPSLFMGEVVRCKLHELIETNMGQKPLYFNGIRFQIERTAEESSLLQMMQLSRPGEKRLGGPRVVPSTLLMADVGKVESTRVVDLEYQGFTLCSETMPEIDEEWHLLLQIGKACMRVTCRLENMARDPQGSGFRTRLRFVGLSAHEVKFLRNYLRDKASLN